MVRTRTVERRVCATPGPTSQCRDLGRPSRVGLSVGSGRSSRLRVVGLDGRPTHVPTRTLVQRSVTLPWPPGGRRNPFPREVSLSSFPTRMSQSGCGLWSRRDFLSTTPLARLPVCRGPVATRLLLTEEGGFVRPIPSRRGPTWWVRVVVITGRGGRPRSPNQSPK